MGDKLLLLVLLPATLTRHEFKVPLDLDVERGARLIARILAVRSEGRYEASDEVDLMHGEGRWAGRLIVPQETFRSLVLKGQLMDGSLVVLM